MRVITELTNPRRPPPAPLTHPPAARRCTLAALPPLRSSRGPNGGAALRPFLRDMEAAGAGLSAAWSSVSAALVPPAALGLVSGERSRAGPRGGREERGCAGSRQPGGGRRVGVGLRAPRTPPCEGCRTFREEGGDPGLRVGWWRRKWRLLLCSVEAVIRYKEMVVAIELLALNSQLSFSVQPPPLALRFQQ